jgi:hypothetical protein
VNATPSPFGLVAQQLTTNGKKRVAEDDEEVFDESITKKTKPGESLDPSPSPVLISRRATCAGRIRL